MRVSHVMTKDPGCCVPSDGAPRAASIMRAEDTGIVPVIDNEQSQRVVPESRLADARAEYEGPVAREALSRACQAVRSAEWT